ncbi:MAG: benzoate transporter BenE [Alphaproteobacteria bacterium]|nr:benzoate transporter BenE [Alphaproteobacteria bacterium]
MSSSHMPYAAEPFPFHAVMAGLLAAFVGCASSFAVVVHGLKAVGASDVEATSGLMALSIAMGLGGIILSLKTRMPVSVAWSTPGAALLATTGAVPGGFSTAVGAFLVSSILLVIAGLWKPLGRAVRAIPSALANAMLAGILLHLCIAPVTAVAQMPLAGLAIVAVWALVARIKRVLAVPAAVIVLIGILFFSGTAPIFELSALLPMPILIEPQFSLSAIISIAIPLFIVTMASQNIPGIAVLAVHNYRPEPGPLFTVTGILSLLSAPFGGHAVNLAAITAAICAGPDCHPDPAKRYVAGVTAGIVYVLFGFLAGGATALISVSPPVLIEAIAGLALIGAFGAAIMAAVEDSHEREAAVATFLVAASGLTLFGIGGAFWGLIAGGLLRALRRFGTAT